MKIKDTETNPFAALSKLKFDDSEYQNQNDIEDNSDIDEELIDGRKSQKIRVWLEKKKRRGNPVSVIKGFNEYKDDMKLLAKLLKKKLGVGGSFTDDEIIIQSQKRDSIIDLLKAEGFRDIKKSGG